MSLIIDSFAGGGGASTGIEMALGRSPDVAINHDPVALAMHAVNHPLTEHMSNDIWAIDPMSVRPGQPIGLLWASPDCKHFSKAKGGKPCDRNIRDLAWVVVDWAEKRKPDVILLENVEEFKTWGPVGNDGQPVAGLAGHTFEEWVRRLRRAGYKVEWRELRACDYGAPTIRKGVWPETYYHKARERVLFNRLELAGARMAEAKDIDTLNDAFADLEGILDGKVPYDELASIHRQNETRLMNSSAPQESFLHPIMAG